MSEDNVIECVHARYVLRCACVSQERGDLIDANEKLHARVNELEALVSDLSEKLAAATGRSWAHG